MIRDLTDIEKDEYMQKLMKDALDDIIKTMRPVIEEAADRYQKLKYDENHIDL